MSNYSEEIDLLLARMEQTDPYHSRRKAIQQLIVKARLEVAENVYLWAQQYQPDNEMLITATRNSFQELEAQLPKKQDVTPES